jgi:hypothetical protein
MNFLEYPNRKGDKIYFYYDFGRGKGQRPATGVFIYANPKDQIQKNHNKEAYKLLEVKKSQLTIEQQAIGSAFIPAHKFKANFIEYYEEFVKNNRRTNNRHLPIAFSSSRNLSKKTSLHQLILLKTYVNSSGNFFWINTQG